MGLPQLAHRHSPALWLCDTQAAPRGATGVWKGSNDSQIFLRTWSLSSNIIPKFWVLPELFGFRFLINFIVHFTAFKLSYREKPTVFRVWTTQGLEDLDTCSDFSLYLGQNFHWKPWKDTVPKTDPRLPKLKGPQKGISGGNHRPQLGFDPPCSSLTRLILRQDKVQL